MNFRRFSLFLFIVLIFACTKDQMPLETEFDNELRSLIRDASEDGTMSYYILPDESDLANIPQDPKNPLTPEKVALGKLMFFDTGLATDAKFPSGVGTYSCASCHIPSAGFRPSRNQGIADGGVGFGVNGESRRRNQDYLEVDMDVQSARPLSLVNVAYVTNTFWNGQFGSTSANEETEEVWDLKEDTELNHLGFEGIETQNIEGLKTHRIGINKEILDEFGYTALFDNAFPNVAINERYTQFTASLAFSAYIRTIISNKAPFQTWLKGIDRGLSLSEKKGAIVFFGKARCINCHYRPNLGSLEFHVLGFKDMYQTPSFNSSPNDLRNLGRGGFTQDVDDNYKFKVPQLYNLADAPFFFHGSSKTSIEDVVEYKIAAEFENSNIDQNLISSKFGPIELTKEDKNNLILFLTTALRDPDLIRYQPSEVLSGNCFPNNDELSKSDLGCN